MGSRYYWGVKITVIGLGYLGITHAAAMAELGHEVVGIDVDDDKLRQLSNGVVPIFEPGLSELVVRHTQTRRLRFKQSHDAESLEADIHFLCVGTPQAEGSDEADLGFLKAATLALAPHLGRNSVVVGKSTVPVGTAVKIRRALETELGRSVMLAWNPEFLREGTALHDSLNPDRIVIGGDDPTALESLREVYATQIKKGTPVVECGLETAELVKVAANAFLATKISFINAMAEVAEVSGADVVELAKAIGYDERIGNKFLRSGIGFGGGCLPKDIRGFVARAEELGAGDAVSFLKDVDAINQRRRTKVLALAEQELGDLANKRVLVLGLSFKPDSDDMRDSPALDIAMRLARTGAIVTVHDPVSIVALGDKHPDLIAEQDLSVAASDQELVILGTEWAEYRSIDPVKFGELVRNKLIIDGRNVLDVESWQAAGWRLIALGRNVHN